MFFAHLRDAVGEEFIMLDVSGNTVQEVKNLVESKFSGLKLDTVMTAINEEFAGPEEIVQQGDVIAFIPPVSGG